MYLSLLINLQTVIATTDVCCIWNHFFSWLLESWRWCYCRPACLASIQLITDTGGKKNINSQGSVWLIFMFLGNTEATSQCVLQLVRMVSFNIIMPLLARRTQFVVVSDSISFSMTRGMWQGSPHLLSHGRNLWWKLKFPPGCCGLKLDQQSPTILSSDSPFLNPS